jgi:allantoinase
VIDLVVRGERVVTTDGLRPAALLVEGGRIVDVVELGQAAPEAARVVDAGVQVVLPGLVDAHVHVNDPGRAEWEGFASATRAAAAGGVTTIVDMPLNSIPATTTAEALAKKRGTAAGRLSVDCGFWGGVVPANASDPAVLRAMVEAGVCGFKAFLVPSGVDEFPSVDETELRSAMTVLAELGVPLLAHAELAGPAPDGGDPRQYATYLASRPPSWEVEAIRLLIRLSRETGAAVHVVHLSAAEALPDLADARRAGVKITVETCPHYLFFAAENVPAGRTEWKCSPPIRSEANRDRLWAGLAEGTIDFVVSDHSPCTPERKGLESGDFMQAWGGIASLQLRLPVVFTEASRRDVSLETLAKWLCFRPAELAGLDDCKGRIAPGADADLVIFDPDASFEVRPESLYHRHALTPYLGHRLQGVVTSTLLRGEVIYDRGQFTGKTRGLPLTRTHACLH